MISDYITLIRIYQWFKNLIIFAPLLVFGYLFDVSALILTIAGFIIFSLASSFVYILNDIVDAEADRQHPTKRFRPIASGRVSKESGLALGIFLLMMIAFLTRIMLVYVEILFAALVFALIVLTIMYSLFFKHKPILDLMFIAFNFCIRCAAGFVIIGKSGDPWFLLSVFFLALFWVLGKRKVELDVLGKNAVNHRSIYQFYRDDFIYGMTYVVVVLLLVSYGLVTYFSLGAGWVTTLTVPIASFMAFRYLYFIHSKSKIAAHPEMFFVDKQMISVLAVWVIILFCFIYLGPLRINPISGALHMWQTFL